MSEPNSRSFNEQGYLIWDYFVRSKKQRQKSVLNSGLNSKSSATFHKIVGNYEPITFISKLLNKKNKLDLYKRIIDLKTHQLSTLMPEVRLFRITGNDYKPFYFPVSAESTSITSLLQPGSSLGSVGIRSFDVKFEGKDFFTRDKMIQCSLVIYADSLEMIFRDPPTGYAPLSELFTIARKRRVPLREGFSKEVSREQVNKPSSHEIGAMIGYQLPDTGALFNVSERRAIRDTAQMLRMNYTSHNIDVSQDGSVTISVTFVGRLSGTFEDPVYNILSSAPELIALSDIQKDIDQAKSGSDAGSAENKEKVNKLTKRLKEGVRGRFRKFMEALDADEKIHRLQIKPKDINDYNKYTGTFKQGVDEERSRPETPATEVPSKKGGSPDDKQVDNIARTKLAAESVYVNYVFMGDFIQAVVSGTASEIELAIEELKRRSDDANIKGDDYLHPAKAGPQIDSLQKSLQQLKTFKVLFGRVPVVTEENNYVMTSLADIPVSVKTIQEYVFDNIEQKHVSRMTLNSFLEDVVAKIYPDATNKHLSQDASTLPSKISVKSIVLSGENLPMFKGSKQDINIKELPDFLKKTNQKRKKDDDADYFVIYTDVSPKDSTGLMGDPRQDAKNGIYHFNMSKDRGMIKNISFSQNTVRYRKEALMLESVSLYDELKMPYNASISMFGNSLFLPGSVIYINPASLGFGDPRNKRSAAARLGIGGYYVVISVSTSYNNGTLETQLITQHQSWADADSRISTAEELQNTGIFDKAKRIKERDGHASPIQRIF